MAKTVKEIEETVEAMRKNQQDGMTPDERKKAEADAAREAEKRKDPLYPYLKLDYVEEVKSEASMLAEYTAMINRDWGGERVIVKVTTRQASSGGGNVFTHVSKEVYDMVQKEQSKA